MPPLNQQPFWQATEDWHTAGEPFRIVRDLPAGALETGLTVWERRAHIIKTPSHPLDLLRQSLCHEPRGHADMYGGFIVPPNDSGAHFGVLFFHRDGFSTACGHGTIALGHWAVENKLVWPMDPNDEVDVIIDVPSGRVIARTKFFNGKAEYVTFINVASYQISENIQLTVNLNSVKTAIDADISFGGAVYVSVKAKDLGLTIAPEYCQQFIDVQRQIKAQLTDFKHEGRYDIYGVIFFEDIEDMHDPDPGMVMQRNVVVFADGQIDRSPCGSGTAARVAVLLHQGKLNDTTALVHKSIVGTTFLARVEHSLEPRGKFPSCIPSVRGTANLVGRFNFYIDPTEQLYPGFLFR